MEFTDVENTKHILVLEGNVTKDKVKKILDYAELMGSSPRNAKVGLGLRQNLITAVEHLVLENFKGKTFTSHDVRQVHFQIYGEKVRLSTIATYLARLTDKGLLKRDGPANHRCYSLAEATPQLTP